MPTQLIITNNMNQLYHEEAFEKLLTHRLHEEIKSRHDANKKLSKADFEFMEENINNMMRALKKEKGPLLPNEYISRLTIESWYRHKNPKAKVSPANFKILCSFLEDIDIEYSNNPKEQADSPKNISSLTNTDELKKLEGKTYWSYNRFMGTANSYKYGNKDFKINPNEVIRSLFTFGKVTKGNKIHVRRKTSMYNYEGDAEILGNIIYIDLRDAKNKLNFERNSYMGRIDNLHELPIIKCIRLCLVDNEPRAVRLIMVEAKNLNYDETIVSEGNSRVPINDLDKEIIDYLGDFSNVTLSPTPLTINDMLGRIDSLYNYIYKRWTVTSKFIQNHNILIEPVESDTFEIDITDSATLLDFYTYILDEMNGEHAMYFTSIASREYLWNNQTMNLYGQAMHNFIDRGGKIVRFFFVNNLDNLSDEQKKILIEHYNIYGKVNDDSAVYITDEKRLPVRNNKLICVEKNKMAISWEATAERNKTGETEKTEKTGRITKIKATINQGRIKSRIEIMDYLEECGKKQNSQIVRKIGEDDIEKWEKELRNT